MQSLRRNNPLLFFDLIGAWALIAIVSIVTVVFALAYWGITVLSPTQGLFLVGGKEHIPASFLDALYFSVVTETTLGASDIAVGPLGKVLACIQVFAGLALGGVIVAKVTSLRGQTLRLLAHKVQGTWFEYCTMPNGDRVFTYSLMYLTADTLHFDGENYDIDGNPLGFFRSELFDADGATLRFHYSNLDSSMTHFAEGTMTFRFIATEAPDSKRGEWSRYQATVHDFLKNLTITYEGNRPSPEEINAFHQQDRSARKQIIVSYFASRV
ncbi:MAG: hypothetical protein CVU57_31125 [Deltaproteobacteria bacterium HGW-Deltaproteobacteria-15]|jgi:hypothetical protein|nr:MAG: hypothetical protein CVU57_31125 [Deltaproteobacteria bacterium HGW-Deltaproteobacteria-15]